MKFQRVTKKNLMFMKIFQFCIRNFILVIKKKIMTYTMVKKTLSFPTERYLNVVKQGYVDCHLDKKFLKKALKNNKG